MDFDDDEIEATEQPFFRRNRIALGVGAIVVVVAIVGIVKLVSNSGGPVRRDNITLVSLAPPPPPPPPQNSPPPPPPQEQKMEQPMIKEEAPKEVEQPKAPPLGTGIKGDGTGDSFGLGSSGSGRIGGSGSKSTKWVGYASQVQARIEEGLRRNRRTRSASLNVNVRVWPDASGRVSRAQLAGSTGDPSLDSAIRDEVLGNLQLQPPPPDMPTPITLRLAARRP